MGKEEYLAGRETGINTGASTVANVSQDPNYDTERKDSGSLDGQQKIAMESISNKGGEFIAMLHLFGGTSEGHPQANRQFSIAQTKIEEAVMWANKGITR